MDTKIFFYLLALFIWILYNRYSAYRKVAKTMDKKTIKPTHSTSKPIKQKNYKEVWEKQTTATSERYNEKPFSYETQDPEAEQVLKSQAFHRMLQNVSSNLSSKIYEMQEQKTSPEATENTLEEESEHMHISFDIREAIIASEILKRPSY